MEAANLFGSFMGLVIPLILILIVVALVYRAIIIIPQNCQGLVETFGKYTRTEEAGISFMIPFVQQVRKVSLALQPMAVPKYSVITQDNADVQVSLTLNYRVSNARAYFYQNTDSESSLIQLVRGHLRDIIGKMTLDEALGSTAKINAELFDAIDSLTDSYGIAVIRVNIDELDPSAEIQQAMDQQLTADRRKRAMISEAEGNAKSIQLNTDAKNEALLKTAQAQAKAKEIAADAENYRITKVQQALSQADNNYFKNQSLSAFATLADSPTNLVVMSKDELTELSNIPVAKRLWDQSKVQPVSPTTPVRRPNNNGNVIGQ